MSFSDYLGDHRLFVLLNSVDTFSDFNFLYIDQSQRLNWTVQIFDQREFFIVEESITGDVLERSRSILRETGVVGSLRYPMSFYHRVEAGVGYVWRNYDFPVLVEDPVSGLSRIDFLELDQAYPLVTAALIGDTSVFTADGPISGYRYRARGFYGYDTDEGGALTENLDLDFRTYLPITQRMQFAIRAFAGYAGGTYPSLYALGGLDTLRGFEYRTIVGDRAFYTNFELRFPLIDYIQMPLLRFRGVRGRIFLDVGGAWNDYLGQDFDFWDSDESRLEDAVSSYGWGVTVNFLGLDLNWDFAQTWDFKDSTGEGFETDFWIGTRF
jgi:outer membrane protein assembly factor BamA